ncbi:MAG: tetratricopeptide (TPR) repeat protein [Granulosicoccus sp.]|jgi:tetratricopeptide (TPR) repeat protein
MLDSDELFHLGLKEMQNGSSEKAIETLKKCLQQDPKNAKALYLLGALHAEIGMYDRSMVEMKEAIELDNSLTIARFQLGLLHFTSNNTEEAKEIWQGLDELGESEPLFLFKRGLLLSTEGDMKLCIADLEQGISLNTNNDALNNDMRTMIAAAEKELNTPAATDIEPAADAKAPKQLKPTSSTLSAYSQNDND